MAKIKDNTVQVVFVSLLLDLLAFTMILPLLPALLDYYKEIEKNQGFLGSMYSFLQFLSSPIVGALSDIYGRKPLMICCLIGIALSYLLWAFSCNFAIFVLARFIGGISKGNINLSMAIISDVTSPKTRGKAMALIGIAFSIGFVVGPMIGAFFAWTFSDNKKEAWYIIPAVFAFFLATSDLCFIVYYLKESLPQKYRSSNLISGISGIITYINPIDLFQFNGVSGLSLQDKKNLKTLGCAYFIYLFIYSGLEFTLTFLTHYLFKFTSMQQGWMFLGIGLIMAILQGSWIRTIPSNKTKSIAELGLWLIIPAFICIGLANDILTLSIGLCLFAISTAMVVTCMMTLVTHIGPDYQKGAITGVFRSLGALARACGPIVASSAFWCIGSKATYLIGAIFLILPPVILQMMKSF
ncbi:major facilitator superfamily domain-containing protein 10 isoform X2 [Apis laboriosa]|uniref:major facilitator superfamily domain-containing protein 10 isoform X2 n=1 Tax=Apis laboriosa TaxID=183418 RepID=UPI001CC47654|nr:major facilitator superfamily domain-containing protein 10 isoform X2 [Apis laboriosa]